MGTAHLKLKDKPRVQVSTLKSKAPSFLSPKEALPMKEGQRFKVPGGEMEFTTIDPDMAQLLLEHRHPCQRPSQGSASKSHVGLLAETITRGEWVPNLEAIHVDRDLRLINGQHRCLAVIKAGIPIKNFIMVVDDPNAFYALDQGRVRSINDIRVTLGKKPVCSTIRGAILMEHNDFQRLSGVSKRDQDKILDEFTLMDEVQELYNIGKKSKTKIVGVGVLGAAIRCMRAARQDAFEFFTAVLEMRSTVNGEEAHQAHLLYTWLLYTREEQGRSTGEFYVKEAAFKSVRAWNAWRDGETLMKLQYSPGAKIPKAKR